MSDTECEPWLRGENGRIAYDSTDSPALDFFSGVVPGMATHELFRLLSKAWNDDPEITLRLIFQTGNMRNQGKMDHHNFMRCIAWLWQEKPTTILMNINAFKTHTYLKDLLTLLQLSQSQDAISFVEAKMQRNQKVDKSTIRQERASSRWRRKEAFAASIGQTLSKILVNGNKEDVRQYVQHARMDKWYYKKHIASHTNVEPTTCNDSAMQGLVQGFANQGLTPAVADIVDSYSGDSSGGDMEQDDDDYEFVDSISSEDISIASDSNKRKSHKDEIKKCGVKNKKGKFAEVSEPIFPRVQWVNEAIELQWKDYVLQEERERVSSEKTARKEAKKKFQMQAPIFLRSKKYSCESDSKSTTLTLKGKVYSSEDTLPWIVQSNVPENDSNVSEQLFDTVVDIFANGLAESFMVMIMGKGQPMSCYAKWAPSLNGSHAKTIHGIVDTIAKRTIEIIGVLPIKNAISLGVLAKNHMNGIDATTQLGFSHPTILCIYANILSKLRGVCKIPEHFVGQKQFSNVDYNSMPSICRQIWGQQVFRENDKDRYDSFLKDATEAVNMELETGIVDKNAAKVHAGSLLAHQITLAGYDSYNDVCDLTRRLKKSNKLRAKKGLAEDQNLVSELEKATMAQTQSNLQWHRLIHSVKQDMMSAGGGISAFIPVCDVSGSMGFLSSATSKDIPQPIDVSIALSLVLACVNSVESGWRGKLFSFSETPQLVTVFPEEDSNTMLNIGKLVSKVVEGESGFSTDIEATMDLFLQHSIKVGTSVEDMEKQQICIFSDMEFDQNIRGGQHDYAWENIHESFVNKFKKKGYESSPGIIFWNLRSSVSQVVHDKNSTGVALLSGYSQGMLKCFLSGDIEGCSAAAPAPLVSVFTQVKEKVPKLTPMNTMMRILALDQYTGLKVAPCDQGPLRLCEYQGPFEEHVDAFIRDA
jgi:hypothetical protein